jgi:hypothetical protein
MKTLGTLGFHPYSDTRHNCQLYEPAALNPKDVSRYSFLSKTEFIPVLTNTDTTSRLVAECLTQLSPLTQNRHVRNDHRYTRAPDPLCIHTRILHLTRAVRWRIPFCLYNTKCVRACIFTILVCIYVLLSMHLDICLQWKNLMHCYLLFIQSLYLYMFRTTTKPEISRRIVTE